jgi:NDP-sugar pyrophosphorylase family protein
MKYKLFIPCAGTGSRLKYLTKNKNKALIKVGGKEVIRHIIDKFKENIPIIIAIGYQGKQVKNFLKKIYPKRDITFIEVDNYEGSGSGLGYSMSKCKEKLQCPFLFNSNDTIVLEDIPAPDKNYIGYAKKQNVAQFRSIKLKDNKVVELCEKGANGNVRPYIGLSGIKDYSLFWETLEKKSEDFFKIGESAGLKHLIDKNLPVEGIEFTWLDTGNPKSLEITKAQLEQDIKDQNISL